MTTSHPGRIVAVLCTAGTVCLTGFAAFPALLPLLRDEWGLRNAEAGLISSMFFGGYVLAVPVLTSLTDRVDARRIYISASSLAAMSAMGQRNGKETVICGSGQATAARPEGPAVRKNRVVWSAPITGRRGRYRESAVV